MDFKVLIILYILGIAAAVNVESKVSISSPVVETSNITENTPSETKITTVSPTSIAEITSTTTVITSTTTATPSSTTATPPTTTEKPSTTVAPLTTPSPQPTPADPEIGKWSFSADNKTCIIIQMAVKLNITYTKYDNTKSYFVYNLPANQSTVLNGTCLKITQQITVQWGAESARSFFFVQFDYNETTSTFGLSEIMFKINATANLPYAKENQTIILYHTGSIFDTPLDMSYHCTRPQTLNLTGSESRSDIIGAAMFSHIQLEAFHNTKDTHFSTARDCDAIDTPDIVPIAVGCALAGLIVVVLVAYLVGRTRRDTRGYLSM